MSDENKNVNEEEVKNDELNLDDLEDIQGGDIGNAVKIRPTEINNSTSGGI